MQRFNTAAARKRPALFHCKGTILQQDNTRPHTARMTQDQIQVLGWEKPPHPSYSPDIAPSDFHLFRSLNNNYLRGKNSKELISKVINNW